MAFGGSNADTSSTVNCGQDDETRPDISRREISGPPATLGDPTDLP